MKGDTHNLEVDASHQKSRVRNPLPALNQMLEYLGVEEIMKGKRVAYEEAHTMFASISYRN
jgi:hypothetical protein